MSEKLQKFIFPGRNLRTLNDDPKELQQVFNEYGVLIFPKLLEYELIEHAYIRDIKWLLHKLVPNLPHCSLDEALELVAKKDKSLLKHVAGLGTQPNQLVSANELKFNHKFMELAKSLLGPSSVIGTPSAGDTLHIFPPGTDMHKYNLPIHQDYQYLMQSPKQLTYYINFTEKNPDIGGVSFWPKSHKEGIKFSHRNENGSWEIISGIHSYAQYDIVWDVGDLAIFDSLTWHKSIPNTSKSRCRMVQLFRFSDLNNAEAKKYNWKSTTYKRENVLFEEHHKDLYK